VSVISSESLIQSDLHLSHARTHTHTLTHSHRWEAVSHVTFSHTVCTDYGRVNPHIVSSSRTLSKEQFKCVPATLWRTMWFSRYEAQIFLNNFLIFLMKIDIDEAYIYRSRTIIPFNEVDCSRDVETRPPAGVWLSLEWLRVPQTCTQLSSMFIFREYWRTGSFKQCQRAFWNKYGEGSVPTKSCIHKLVKKLENRK
jgi:hypothetical protein